MSEYKYILEPYKGMSTRYRCPSCKLRNKTFSLYIDKETGEHLHHTVGRCNRESNCGHHYTPKQYFKDCNISFDKHQQRVIKPRSFAAEPKAVSFIPVEFFKGSLKEHGTNHFVQFLINQFGVDISSELVSRYFIATSKHWNGATVFWQIDAQGKVRTGKIMLYSPITGKRVKNIELPIYWAHKALKQPDFVLRQCLFGEHLLIDKSKPVAIVESEKTAVIASVYLPHFIWVAVGSLTNLSAERCSVLKGRTVVLFPDLNGFEKWSNRAKELSHLATFVVSDLLERKATEAERKQGFDLADYLIKFDCKAFAVTQPEVIGTPQVIQPLVDVKRIEQAEVSFSFGKPEQPMHESWEHDIIELQNYFESIAAPTQPIRLNTCSTITNYSLFLESHFATVRANYGKRTYLPYLNRLKELKQVLMINSN